MRVGEIICLTCEIAVFVFDKPHNLDCWIYGKLRLYQKKQKKKKKGWAGVKKQMSKLTQLVVINLVTYLIRFTYEEFNIHFEFNVHYFFLTNFRILSSETSTIIKKKLSSYCSWKMKSIQIQTFFFLIFFFMRVHMLKQVITKFIFKIK